MSAGGADRDTCLTCGDVAVRGEVVAVRGATAVVDVDGGLETVATELVDPVAEGDVLLCHAGIALQKLDRHRSPATGIPPQTPFR